MSFFLYQGSPAPAPDRPAIDAADRGFQLGDGVFDTLTAPGGRPFALERHLARLQAAAAFLGFEPPGERLSAVVADVAKRLDGRDAILRTTVSRGLSARGLWPAEPPSPTIVVTAQPWSRSLIGQPATLSVGKVPRNERSPVSRLKAVSYLDNILAAREAQAEGCDDALLLNLEGRPVCSTIANVFILDGGRLLTPPTSEGCLDGILRAIVLEEAPLLGIEVGEVPFALSDLLAAECCFLTNSVRLLRPVRSVAGTPMKVSSFPGALLARLLARIERDTGAAIAFGEISPDITRSPS